MFQGAGKPLSEAGLQQQADAAGIALPALWAVMTVETKGCGFMPDRRPVILFERHVFRRQTDAAFDQSDPDLSNPAAGGYGKPGAFQYEKLMRAIALNRRAALESTSWGLGQVMGFNAVDAGFSDVEAMVTAVCASEDAQFAAMMGFIRTHGLVKHLQKSDWSHFARSYNGPSFKRNNYDKKLARAWERFSVGPLPSVRVRAAQLYLTFLEAQR